VALAPDKTMIARMRFATAGVLLVCLCQPAAFGQCAPAPDSAYFFRNLSEQRAEARIAANHALYEKLLSAAFEMKGADGKPVSKQKFIANELTAPPAATSRRFFSISNYTLVEHRQGHTVAAYLLREVTTGNGATRIAESTLRETYQVENGEWRLAAVEVSPVKDDASTTRAGS